METIIFNITCLKARLFGTSHIQKLLLAFRKTSLKMKKKIILFLFIYYLPKKNKFPLLSRINITLEFKWYSLLYFFFILFITTDSNYVWAQNYLKYYLCVFMYCVYRLALLTAVEEISRNSISLQNLTNFTKTITTQNKFYTN